MHSLFLPTYLEVTDFDGVNAPSMKQDLVPSNEEAQISKEIIVGVEKSYSLS